MLTKRSQSGQGLLEAIIAIGILLTAIIIIISLSIASTDLGSANETRRLATNLAREGLEAIRQQRDSNWLDDQAFYTNITTGDTFADPIVVIFFPSVNQIVFSSSSVYGDKTCYQKDPIDCTCYGPSETICKIYYLDGVYAHGLPAGREDTPYYRLIFINLFESDGSPTVTAGSSTVEMQVISQVYWVEDGRARDVTLETTLFDWKTNND